VQETFFLPNEARTKQSSSGFNDGTSFALGLTLEVTVAAQLRKQNKNDFEKKVSKIWARTWSTCV
jgi:hypothetical protein